MRPQRSDRMATSASGGDPRSRITRKRGRVARAASIALLAASTPLSLGAQQGIERLQVGVRAGIATLGVGCSVGQQESSLAFGLGARAGGQLAVSVVVDGYYRGSLACTLPGPVPVIYRGEEVESRAGSFHPIRAGVRVHYEVAVSSLRLDIGGGMGGFPGTRIVDGDESVFAWQPWYGGILGLRVPGARLSGEVEIGRHSAASMTYLTTADARAVRSWRQWSWLIGAAVSYRIGGS